MAGVISARIADINAAQIDALIKNAEAEKRTIEYKR